MYCGHGLPLFMCTRTKLQVAAGDCARRENMHSREDAVCGR